MGSRPRSRGSPADRRRRRRGGSSARLRSRRLRFRAPRSGRTCSARLSAVVNGRPANSSCVRSRPVSMIVSGLPGPGRNGAVRVHERNPPVRSFRRRCLKRRERLVGRDLGDEVRAEQSRQNLERGARRHPPDRKRRGDLHGARFPQRGPCARLREHEPCAVGRELVRERAPCERRRRHGERESSEHDHDPETLQDGEHSTSVENCFCRYRLQPGRP